MRKGPEVRKEETGWFVIDTDGDRVGPFVTCRGAVAYAAMVAGWR